MTKLSIVTITKNNPEGMFKTLNSIPDDHSDYLQYIVVDGDIKNRMDTLRWIVQIVLRPREVKGFVNDGL
jgi:hypothetical protein